MARTQQSEELQTSPSKQRKISNNNTKNKKKKQKSKKVRSGSFWEAIMDPKLVWRPTINDVERISFGKPAKKKGTGSRGVPHRLNADERRSFDQSRKRGYLEIDGSGWRSQRRDAPLLNTYRSLCDARGQPSIVVHKNQQPQQTNSGNGDDDHLESGDTLVVDISPLRTPHLFDSIARQCVKEQPGGTIMFIEQQEQQESIDEEDVEAMDNDSMTEKATIITETPEHDEDLSLTLSIVEATNHSTDNSDNSDNGVDIDSSLTRTVTNSNEVLEVQDENDDNNDSIDDDEDDEFGSDWYSRPIYQLPPYYITWQLPRNEAKAVGKKMAKLFDTIEPNKGGGGSSKKPIGVKPGKNRRHGGYGIG